MRTSGLAKDGVYSAENLAFKLLRNGDHLQKLSSLKISAYDKMMSLGPVPEKDEKLMENWVNYINSED